jgi:8-amino-7-oxononanoate synthase
MSAAFRDLLSQRLVKQYSAGLKRQLKTGVENLVDFASNDYLGLARSRELADRIEKEFRPRKNINGSTGSRLLTGNSEAVIQTEEYLARVFKAEAGLICNSGYAANLAVLSAIPQKNDTILYDELAHASIKDGARLSLAKRFAFRHNNLDDLELKLRKVTGQAFIVIESVYSMDGDRSPLKEISFLARKYNASVVLDEAHGTGMFTPEGAGIAVSENLQDDIDIRIYTFGKAVGIHGAYVTGRKELAEFLINFSRPFIYTTALSPHSITSIRCAFDYLKEHQSLFHILQKNIETYKDAVRGIPEASVNDTAIQIFHAPGNMNAKKMAELISDQGIDVRPILSPTVPVGKERLRICLHSFNSEGEILKLCTLLKTHSIIQPV